MRRHRLTDQVQPHDQEGQAERILESNLVGAELLNPCFLASYFETSRDMRKSNSLFKLL